VNVLVVGGHDGSAEQLLSALVGSQADARSVWIGDGVAGQADVVVDFGLGTLADARLSTNVSLLGSSIESSEITDGTIVNVDINVSAAIADTKLGTIATAGKVADTALSTNVAFLNRSSPTFTGTNVFSGRVSIGSGGTTLTSVICASATLDFGSR